MPRTDRLNRIAKELVRYHNAIDACMVPDSPLLAGNTEAQAVIRNLESWQKTDTKERGNPPHLVAGMRLHGSIHQDIERVFDALCDVRPELAKRWDHSFKELFRDIFNIMDDWKSGCDGYDASLGKAYCLALRAAKLAKRVDAHAQELAHEPSAGDEKALSIPEAAKRLSINRSTLYRWRDAKPPKIPLSIFVTIGGREKVVESKLAAWILEKSEESQR